MFKLFGSKQMPFDFSNLGTDMHSHLLPGIDDGAPDLAISLTLIRALQHLGYQKIITTPHIRAEIYPNTRDIILKKRDEVRNALEKEESTVPQFEAAAEYYIDENFEQLLMREPLLSLDGKRVLVEMSFFQPYPNLHKVLFDMQMKGYQPVLAHPERYPYVKTIGDLEKLKQLGCELQVNILSFTGYHRKEAQQTARLLLKNQLIDFLGSDLHHNEHVNALQKAISDKYLANALQVKLKNNTLLP